MSGVGVPPPQPVALTQASCGSSSNIWGVDATNTVYSYTTDGTNWTQTQMPGKMKQVSAADDTTIWGLKADGTLWQYTGNAWVQKGNSQTKQVSAASDGTVWTVMPDNTVFQITATGRTQIVV
jgi:virginiamycin B lyase